MMAFTNTRLVALRWVREGIAFQADAFNIQILDIALYPSMPICQLIVEQVSGIPFRNDSQFQNQAHPGGR
jgi:hypothetical protein